MNNQQWGNYNQITKWIADGTVDVGFVPLPSRLKTIPIKTDRLKLVVSNGNPLSKKREISIKDIHEMPFIMPVAGCELQIQELFKKHKINFMDLVENPSRTIAISYRDKTALSPAGKEFIHLIESNTCLS